MGRWEGLNGGGETYESLLPAELSLVQVGGTSGSYDLTMGDSFIEKIVIIPAEPTRIFWDLLDPANVPTYDSHFQYWIPRVHPPKVGTKVDFKARVGRIWLTAVSEFVEFDPPEHLALRQVSPPSPMRSRLTWNLEPTDEGTRFTYRFELSSPPGTGWLRAWLLRAFTGHLDDELPALADRYRRETDASSSP